MSPSPPVSFPVTRSGRLPPGWIQAAVIVAVGIAAYLTSFAGAFQFDDLPAILENKTVQRLWPLTMPLSPPVGALTVSGRPLLNLSFALNYAISGYHLWSYHALNLAVHLAAALTLFGIVRRTWRDADWPAVAVAALWVAHPLTTEAVTYIVQRAESLMGLCYLLTLYGFIRASDSPRGARWKILSVLCCLVGVGTKEVIVTAPLAVLFYDRAFRTPSWREVWTRGQVYYVSLFATWIPLALLVASGGWDRGQTAGFAVGVSWQTYWLSQGEAMFRYLGLALWPHPLALEYGLPSASFPLQAVLTVLAVAAAAAAAIGSIRGRPWAFPVTASILILAPTSILPGVLQFMAEHRFYLPLAAMLAGLVFAVRVLAQRLAPESLRAPLLAAGAAGLVLLLTAATAQRNRDYRSDLTLWLESVAVRPGSGLAQANAGYALLTRGRAAEAVPYCEAAVRLDPMKANAHYNLGMAYEEVNRREAALDQFETAIRLNPRLAYAEFRAGRLLDTLGQPARAEKYLRQSLALDPAQADAHGSLGVALAALDHPAEAVSEYEQALRLRAEQPEVEFNLGLALARLGQLTGAARHYAQAVALRPDYGEAQLNWGVALCQLERTAEALPALRAAVRLLPASPEAHANLAAALDERGFPDEAVAEYHRAIALRPDYPTAQFNLARALRRRARP